MRALKFFAALFLLAPIVFAQGVICSTTIQCGAGEYMGSDCLCHPGAHAVNGQQPNGLAPLATVPTPTTPPSTVAQSESDAQSFFFAGLIAQPSTAPHPTGGIGYAAPMNKNQGVYAIAETDLTIVRGGGSGKYMLQNQARAGIAIFTRRIWIADIFVLGDAGVSSTGSATSGAYAGGAIAKFPLRAGSKFCGLVGFRIVKSATANGTQTYLTLGVGR